MSAKTRIFVNLKSVEKPFCNTAVQNGIYENIYLVISWRGRSGGAYLPLVRECRMTFESPMSQQSDQTPSEMSGSLGKYYCPCLSEKRTPRSKKGVSLDKPYILRVPCPY